MVEKPIMSKMPVQKPGKSEQVVCTPTEFMNILTSRLGIDKFGIDLAASADNTVADDYYTEENDSLVQPWTDYAWAYCNPPYADIEPWVRKAWTESHKGANIAMLLPASVGSNWWRTYVDKKAYVLLLNGRLTFKGHTSPYPKDLVVLLYNSFGASGYEVWKWNHEYR